MSSREDTPPLSIQIGATAKLDVKTEIPKEETGRLVAALTDIIRPFTEKRGLRADQIRLQREDVLFAIAQKAKARADLEKIELHPVPTKLLVPFLEKASLEDLDNDMQDRWAALLLSASKAYQAQHLTFVDILSRVSSDELKLLEKVCFSHKAFPETSYPGGHFAENKSRLETNAKMLVLTPSKDDLKIDDAYKAFITASPLTYGGMMHATGRSNHTRYYYGDPRLDGMVGYPPFRSLEILERERLVQFELLCPRGTGIELAYFNVTYLGISFVRDCSPLASEMAARRPAPIQART